MKASNIDNNIIGNTFTNNLDSYSLSSDFIYVYTDDNSYRLAQNKTYDWLANGAPYRMVENLWVWEDNDNNQVAILKLYPGVTMAFDPGVILYIGENGDGDAGALQADSVLFTSVDSSLGWGKIQFKKYTRDDLSFIQNSTIGQMMGCIVSRHHQR